MSAWKRRPPLLPMQSRLSTTLLFAFLSLLLLLLPHAVLGAALVEPVVLRSSSSEWSVTLSVEAARYDDGVGLAFTSRQFCVVDTALVGGGGGSDAATTPGACSFPGPTIHLKPGDIFTLTVLNRLGPNDEHDHRMNSSAAGAGAAGAASEPWTYTDHGTMNMHAHIPNTTNVHTHGLHVSPLVDNVFLHVLPGASRTYRYEIPHDHAPGLHWYHGHIHGTTTLHVMGGLHGAIIVDDFAPPSAATGSPAPAPVLPSSYVSLPSRLLVLSHIQFAQMLSSDGRVTQGCGMGLACTPSQGCPEAGPGTPSSPYALFRSYSYGELSNEAGSMLDTNVVWRGGSSVANASKSDGANQYVVNGQLHPSISMRVGEPMVLRVLHTGGAHTLQWFVPTPSQGCTMTILAIDGVFLSATQPKTKVIHMTQAGRWEIQTVCDKPGTVPLHVEFGGPPRVKQVLLTLVVEEASADPSQPLLPLVTDEDLASIRRPSYLADLTAPSVTSAAAGFQFALHFGHLPMSTAMLGSCGVWLGTGSDCSGVWKAREVASTSLWASEGRGARPNTCPFELFGGQRGGTGSDTWDPSRAYGHVTPLGAVNEIRVYGMGTDMSSAMWMSDDENDDDDENDADGHHEAASKSASSSSTGAAAEDDMGDMGDMDMSDHSGGGGMETHSGGGGEHAASTGPASSPSVSASASSSNTHVAHPKHTIRPPTPSPLRLSAASSGGDMSHMAGMHHMMDEMDTHPFHIHVHHVQVVAFTPSMPRPRGSSAHGPPPKPNAADWQDYFTLGEWRDSLPTLDGELVVRFRAADFPGETMIHCHVLRHEDLGMMTTMYVCDPNAPTGACPTKVMDKLAQLGIAASAAAASAPAATAATSFTLIAAASIALALRLL